jgi:hypothetical protein
MTEDQLSALLRTVKRYEQPPAGYHDQLLRDIHRRQRTELLRMPLWKIALERLQTLFGEHSMGPATYGAAMAGLVVLGVTTIALVTPSRLERQQHNGMLAVQPIKVAPQTAVAAVNPAPLQPLPPTRTVPDPSIAPNLKGPRRYDAGYVPAVPASPTHHFQE